MSELPEYVDGLPNLCGAESEVQRIVQEHAGRPVFLPESGVDFQRVRSAFAVALHMHQPLVPAGGPELRTGAMIGNLQFMRDHPQLGDNHNEGVFAWCYRRLGEFVPQLVHEGKQPRVMLEYSGELLHGLRQMGRHDILDALKTITCDPRYRRCVEWLGAPWGHAVAPSTPVQDFRLHVQAWQHHFAALFGAEALGRLRGFSPSEMALPNHPDTAYAFVRTLLDHGYQWVLVQEHAVERAERGGALEDRHLPHRLVCRNSAGESAEIIAIIKTQGSDTKLIGQMQPYYEAQGLSRRSLGGIEVPPLVTQIADGENGGVMMNEFPGKYFEVMRACSWSDVPALNATEYLEYLFSLGLTAADLPPVQPLHQARIWERFTPGAGPERLAQTLEGLRREDARFHMEGGSWTNDRSWVRGYENVLGPMEQLSVAFSEQVLAKGVPTHEYRYRNALFHLLISQTSCYRYWGQGIWTDYAREICRRGSEILKYDF
ncbi:MAG: glycosyl hydrolase family 57 [Proteobacteria bacterium]|nr:glycosyl hydrolase family 57 [Pseudomonadota bacterium]